MSTIKVKLTEHQRDRVVVASLRESIANVRKVNLKEDTELLKALRLVYSFYGGGAK